MQQSHHINPYKAVLIIRFTLVSRLYWTQLIPSRIKLIYDDVCKKTVLPP